MELNHEDKTGLLEKYINQHRSGISYKVVGERVFSKGYHDEFNYCFDKLKMTRAEAKLRAGPAGHKLKTAWSKLVRLIRISVLNQIIPSGKPTNRI